MCKLHKFSHESCIYKPTGENCFVKMTSVLYWLMWASNQPTLSQTRPPEEKPRPEAGPVKQILQAECQTVSSGHPQMIPPLRSPEHIQRQMWWSRSMWGSRDSTHVPVYWSVQSAQSVSGRVAATVHLPQTTVNTAVKHTINYSCCIRILEIMFPGLPHLLITCSMQNSTTSDHLMVGKACEWR